MRGETQQRYRGERVLVVGLGVSGASALRYLVREGADVGVTDSRAAPAGIEALRAEFSQVEFRLGAFAAPQPLAQFTLAVVSPGVALDEPFVRELAAAGVDIVGDIELFARALQRCPIPRLDRAGEDIASSPADQTPRFPSVVGITGSNGKSTVTTLVGEMAKAAGIPVAVGGNLGTPALDLLADDVELYVLELSSFQLEATHSLRCTAAALLNLSQDHLDRHGTMAHYGAIKARIFDGCETAVVNRDDAAVRALSPHKAVTFGLDEPDEGHYGLRDVDGEPWLCCGVSRLTSHVFLRIHGRHNWANALAALALADAAGIPREAQLAALHAFPGLPHRCEFVRELDGVRYFNDSKGTNVGSTQAALQGLPAPIVWLGGGQGKGQSFTPLRDVLAVKATAAILFGEDAAAIEHDILGVVPIFREPDMHASLQRARALARAGDQVLLSPACASFDQFRSYVDRGRQFCAAVEALT